jgi:hypothetical protein
VREREREREREFLLCGILLYSQRKEEHPKTSGGFSFLSKKKSEISLGFRVHLSLIRRRNFTTKVLKYKRGTERERERDFARETERER